MILSKADTTQGVNQYTPINCLLTKIELNIIIIQFKDLLLVGPDVQLKHPNEFVLFMLLTLVIY